MPIDIQPEALPTSPRPSEYLPNSDRIAVINAGSSSIKFALYEASPSLTVVFRGQLEQIGVKPCLHIANAEGECVVERQWPVERLDHAAATRESLRAAVRLNLGLLDCPRGRRVSDSQWR